MLLSLASQDGAVHEELLVQTLAQAVDAVVVIDESNCVILFNAAAEALWGWPSEEVLGRNVSMLVPHGIRAVHDSYVNANRTTGVNRIVGTSRDVLVERCDGTRLWASMSISRVVVGPRILYTAFLKDITAQRAQQQHLRQLSLVADRSGHAMAVADAHRRITYVNAGFTRLLGFTSAQALGQCLPELGCGPDTDAHSANSLRMCAEAGQEIQLQVLLYTRAGRPLWVSVMMNPVRDACGALEHIVYVLTDSTHAKAHEVQHKVLDAMAHGLSLGDAALLLCREVERIAPEVTITLRRVDAAGCLRVFAAPSLPPRLKSLIDVAPIGPEAGCCGMAASSGKAVLSIDIATDPCWTAAAQRAFIKQGLRACWSNPIKARDGKVLGTLAFYYRKARGLDALHTMLADVGLHLCALLLERERAHIHQLAYYDTLTGLANRSMLRMQTERMLCEARRNATPLALVFIDLDRFKQINDTQGHQAGDVLLRNVAACLQENVRPGDVAARMGGDEFVLVLPRCDAHAATLVAERLMAAVVQIAEAGGASVYPAASLGIAMYPEDGDNADDLLRCADLAMYQAKTEGGRNFRFYRTEMNARVQERARLEADLRAALTSGNGLALHYQPQLQGGALRGVEALLRWQHPELGFVNPQDIVHLAEECGLLDRLTQWVLHTACRQMADWRARGIVVPQVSVNFEASSFRDSALPQRLVDTLAAYGLQARDLTVEITESVMLSPDPAVRATMQALRACGIALSLDDFGTGYSSLGVLHRMPINEIKLDKSFVQDIDASDTARALTCAMLHIGESLGMQVVAEGVETEAQRSFLLTRGGPVLQGYLMSRPLPVAALEAWLAEKL